jgi:2-methylcitrate dehydratase PrpD
MSAVLAQTSVSDTSSTTISDVLAGHLAALRFEDLPSESVAAAKRFMLDTLAVAWAGSSAPGCAEAREVLLEEGGRELSTVWAYGDRMPPGAAAFLNSMFGAALDFDSLGRDAPSHVYIVVLPAALALAEREHASGRLFMAALVAGVDLMSRLGASCEVHGTPHKGWSYTCVHGVLGAAAAASVILRLDREQTRHALGIAYAQAAGTQQAFIEPSLTKRMQPGFAARSGVLAALLAARGITAPREIIEGQCGLFPMYQPGDVARLLHGLGTSFESGAFTIKKFPSCGCNHAAIEGALRLAREHDLAPDDISDIEVVISPFMNKLVGGAFEPDADPQVAAQFSIQYSIACAIVRRKFGLAELETSVVHDRDIGALLERVRVIVDPDNRGKRGPMTLRMHSRSHGMLSCTVEHVPGSDEAPMTEQEIMEKGFDCFGLGVRPLSRESAQQLTSRILEIDTLSDMGLLFDGIDEGG